MGLAIGIEPSEGVGNGKMRVLVFCIKSKVMKKQHHHKKFASCDHCRSLLFDLSRCRSRDTLGENSSRWAKWSKLFLSEFECWYNRFESWTEQLNPEHRYQDLSKTISSKALPARVTRLNSNFSTGKLNVGSNKFHR